MASGRPLVASFMNRGAATAVPTDCSEHASILHYFSAFICYIYVILMSVAVDSVYKQYNTVTVQLILLSYCYTAGTIHCTNSTVLLLYRYFFSFTVTMSV